MFARELRREERRRDVVTHVALVALLRELDRRVHRYAARDRSIGSELTRSRRREDERAHAIGTIEGHPLRDASAHRMTYNVRGLEAERIEQTERIGCEEPRRVAAGRRRGRTGPAMVERHHRVARRDRVEQIGMPRRAGIAGAGDEKERHSRTATLVRDRVAGDVDVAALARAGRAYRLRRAHLIRGKL